VHTVGDLEANTYYNVKLDTVLGSNITGAGCTAGSCLSDNQGEITFTYTGTYSSHTFDVEEGDNTAPVLSFSNDVVAGPVQSDTITASWGDATIKKWDYDADGTCSNTAGSYSKTDTDSLDQADETNNGKYICLYGEDANGNKDTLVSSNDINIDITAPDSFTLSSPANDAAAFEAGLTFSWNAAVDSGSGIAKYQLYIDSVLDTDDISGTSATPTIDLACGSHTWYVKAIDSAGNSANSSTYNLTILCGSTPVWFLQQLNQQPASNPPTTDNTSGNNISVTAPTTVEQILTEAKIVDLADVNKIAVEASATRDIKVESNYDKTLIAKILSVTELAQLKSEDRASLSGFISYGTASTKILGASERAGVVNSFKSAFGKLPTKEADWSDIIKIANGRWPTQRSKTAEERANINFKSIYKRQPNRKNTHDDAAITVMAYGLRPAKRNLGSEKTAIKSFKAIYCYNPVKATAWDAVRAIAYSGAKR
jgi:hypothetical protein